MKEQFLTLKEVVKITRLSRSTIYRQIRKGLFPYQKIVSTRSVGWRLSEIMAWMESRSLPSVCNWVFYSAYIGHHDRNSPRIL